MNIAMMTNNYKPSIGGVPISVERLSQGLRELGHNVYIFAPSYPGADKDDDNIIRYADSPLSMGMFTIPNSFDRRIGQVFANLQIDLIHTHHPIMVGNSAKRMSSLHNVPLIFTWHTQYENYLHHFKFWDKLEKTATKQSGFSGAAARILVKTGREQIVRNYLRRYAKHCDLIIAPSESMKKLLQEDNVAAPIQVLATGVNDAFFDADAAKIEEIRARYKGDKKYLFCTVCRISKEKNLWFVLSALATFKAMAGDCFRHLLIGDGNMREQIAEQARVMGLESNIEFVGNIKNDDLAAYYAATDLFLFASKTETQGIVLLEAMALGTPVVALRASGVCDVVEDGVNGMLTEENAHSFAQAMQILLEQPGNPAMEAARKTARQYSVASVATKAENIYHAAIEANRKEVRYDAVEPVY